MTFSVPSMTCKALSACKPSCSAFTVTSPPSMEIQPLPSVSSLSALMPSPPAVMSIVPPQMPTPSLPRRPSSTALTVMSPPVMISSSLLEMPRLSLPCTFSLPLPLIVRSHSAQTQAFASSSAA